MIRCIHLKARESASSKLPILEIGSELDTLLPGFAGGGYPQSFVSLLRMLKTNTILNKRRKATFSEQGITNQRGNGSCKFDAILDMSLQA